MHLRAAAAAAIELATAPGLTACRPCRCRSMSLICGDVAEPAARRAVDELPRRAGDVREQLAVEKNSTWICALAKLGGTGLADVADHRAGLDRLVEQRDLAGLARLLPRLALADPLGAACRRCARRRGACRASRTARSTCRASCRGAAARSSSSRSRELAPMRAATRRPGNGANTGRASLRGEVNAAVPQPRLAPRPDREEAAVGALLVRLVELGVVVLELVGLLGDARLRPRPSSARRLRKHREAERAAQLAAEVLEVERARIPLLIRQVVVADVAGERRTTRDVGSVSHDCCARRSTAGTRPAGSAAGAAARARAAMNASYCAGVKSNARIVLPLILTRLDVALGAEPAARVVVRLLLRVAAVAELDADRGRCSIPPRDRPSARDRSSGRSCRRCRSGSDTTGRARSAAPRSTCRRCCSRRDGHELLDHGLHRVERRVHRRSCAAAGRSRVAPRVRRAAGCRTARRPACTPGADRSRSGCRLARRVPERRLAEVDDRRVDVERLARDDQIAATVFVIVASSYSAKNRISVEPILIDDAVLRARSR